MFGVYLKLCDKLGKRMSVVPKRNHEAMKSHTKVPTTNCKKNQLNPEDLHLTEHPAQNILEKLSYGDSQRPEAARGHGEKIMYWEQEA